MASYPDPWVDDGKVWAYYDVTTTESATTLLYHLASISAMEVDGETVTLAKSYTFDSIGEHLVKFTLTSASVISGGDGCWRTVNRLRRLYMPDTVTSIGGAAFMNNTGVTYIRISPALTSLSANCFSGCSSLDIEFYAPNLTSLPNNAFQNSGIRKITNLGKISSVPNSAIRGMSRLTDLVLPSTLTSLADASIYSCSALKRVVCYAATPPTKASNVFSGSTLTYIKVPPASVDAYKTATNWSSYASKIYPLWEEAPIAINHMSLGDFRRRIMAGISTPNRIVPAADGKIWAYYDVTTTESATTLIGATTGIGGTMNVDGVNVTRATSYTFSTTGTHLVKFTPTTTYIGRGVFRNIARIVELYLPSSIIRTDGANDNTNCLNGCANLVTIGLSTSFRNAYAHDFKNLASLTEIKNYEVITVVGNYAFQNLPNWEVELNMPNLTSFGERAFQSTGITKIINLGSITSLKGGANSSNAPFLNCSKLTEATLPATLTTITQFSFYNCAKLKTLTMLATTPPTLGSDAFRGTTVLDNIYVPAESVETYKAASGWSYWANIISAIPTT